MAIDRQDGLTANDGADLLIATPAAGTVVVLPQQSMNLDLARLTVDEGRSISLWLSVTRNALSKQFIFYF
ncbi:MAG: hypothetical protein U5O39_01055 [Gammaproteobacteria bacterium]|nr:hypothetical protein [Gammaproteobacteria bacterium]